MAAAAEQPRDPLRAWKIAGLVASVVIVLAVPLYGLRSARGGGPDAGPVGDLGSEATFVGRDACVDCHEAANDAWLGSDHDRAMDVADSTTVVGDFNDATFTAFGITSRFFRRDGKYLVHTQGPAGEMRDFEISHTFGFEPLQQYLVPLSGGRLQALNLAWDTERNRWFKMYPDQDIPPDDWLHWTRNGQNWNGMCAECHSTDLRKNYDPTTRTFETTWFEIDVSCEACHGPASRHVEWAEIEPMARSASDDFELVVQTSDVTARQQVEMCAPCHSRRAELGDYDHRGGELLDSFVPSVLVEGSYFADGQILDEVYVYGSFLQSKMFRAGVRCSDCHDAHTLQLVESGNELCIRCHQAKTYDSYEHHFHEELVDGAPSDGVLCVKCHMPERPYMVVDWRADHSIRIPRPDLTLDIGTPNACGQSGCHDDQTDQWSADYFTEWYGKARRAHYGPILDAGRRGQVDAEEPLIRLASDSLYSPIVRATALSLLRGYPGEASERAFAVAVQDDDALIRFMAAQSVNAATAEQFVDLLAPLLVDPVQSVRGEAASRLARVPPDVLQPYQRQDLDVALAEYTAAMERSLDFAASGHNLGNLYSALAEPARAETYYRMALEVDDRFFPAAMNLAVLLSQTGRSAEAETVVRGVLEHDPEHTQAAYSLGLLVAEAGRLEEAVPYLEIAANGRPMISRAAYNLGLVQQQLGRPDEAEAALRQAVEAEPDNLDYLYGLADHYVKRGELTRALTVAGRMISTNPQEAIGAELKAYIEQQMAAAGGSE